MEHVKSILQKIEILSSSASPISIIEKDLLLQHTRNLYEALLNLETSVKPIVNSTPNEIQEPELIQTEESAPTIMANTDLNDESLNEKESEDLASEEETALLPSYEEEKQKEVEESDPEEDNLEEAEVQDVHDNFSLTIEEPIIEEKEEDYESDAEIRLVNLTLEESTEDISITSGGRSLTDFKVWNKDIRSYIGINDKYNFISELFGNNPEAYDEILNELNLCESKNEALQFLENSGITTLYQWKEDGFSEQIFYNVLSQFFASR